MPLTLRILTSYLRSPKQEKFQFCKILEVTNVTEFLRFGSKTAIVCPSEKLRSLPRVLALSSTSTGMLAEPMKATIELRDLLPSASKEV